jgi:electron transport complex protein RnfC
MGLTPTEIAKFVDNDEFERAADAGLMTCIKCGSCSFICPSKIPLVHKFQYGQAQYSAMKKKQ